MLNKQTLIQKAAAFGIAANQIHFDEDGSPFFNADALSRLTVKAAPEIRNIELTFRSFDGTIAVAECAVYLNEGPMRTSFGHCLLNAQLGNGELVATADKAIEIARARALRSGLTSIGFDPVKIILGEALHLTARESIEEINRRAIHAIKDELGMSESQYRQYLGLAVPGRQTTADMQPSQLATAASYFRALRDARQLRQAA